MTIVHPVIDTNKKIQCIYKIKFRNGFYYIGATKDLYNRVKNHISTLKKGSINTTRLLFPIRGTIYFEIIEQVGDIYELYDKEQKYIEIALMPYSCGMPSRCINRIIIDKGINRIKRYSLNQ